MSKHQHAVNSCYLSFVERDHMAKNSSIIFQVAHQTDYILLFFCPFANMFTKALGEKAHGDSQKDHEEFKKIFFPLFFFVMDIGMMMNFHEQFCFDKVVAFVLIYVIIMEGDDFPFAILLSMLAQDLLKQLLLHDMLS